jgi:hypothetical protein
MTNLKRAKNFLELVNKGHFWLAFKYENELIKLEGADWKNKEPYKSLIRDYEIMENLR